MKVPVRDVVIRELEVALPLYGGYSDEVVSGHGFYETKFRVGEDLALVSVTEWSGDIDKTTVEFHQLDRNQVSGYLEYDVATAEEFRETLLRALDQITKKGLDQ